LWPCILSKCVCLGFLLSLLATHQHSHDLFHSHSHFLTFRCSILHSDSPSISKSISSPVNIKFFIYYITNSFFIRITQGIIFLSLKPEGSGLLESDAMPLTCDNPQYRNGIHSSRSSNYDFQMAEKGRQNIHECIGTVYSDQ
jgi:hypothetical protein